MDSVSQHSPAGFFTLLGDFGVCSPLVLLLEEQESSLQAGAADPGSGVTCSPGVWGQDALAARGGQNHPKTSSPLKQGWVRSCHLPALQPGRF